MKYIFILLLLISCISTRKYHRRLMDYQVELHMDTVWIYDKGRLVGSFIHTHDTTWENGYDSILIKDNL